MALLEAAEIPLGRRLPQVPGSSTFDVDPTVNGVSAPEVADGFGAISW